MNEIHLAPKSSVCGKKQDPELGEFGDAVALSHWALMLPHVQFSLPRWKEQTKVCEMVRAEEMAGRCWGGPNHWASINHISIIGGIVKASAGTKEPRFGGRFCIKSDLLGSKLCCGKKCLGPWQRLGPEVSTEEMKTMNIASNFHLH